MTGADHLVHHPDVAQIELVRLRLPLKAPHRAAHGTEVERDLVLVRVGLADGTDGWGECPTLAHPSYSAEYTAAAFALLRDEVVPWLLGGPGSEPVGHPMAVSSVVAAHLDAVLRRSDTSLADRLAGQHGPGRPRLPVTAVVGRTDDLDALLDAVAAAVAAGAAMVKLKVSPHPADLAGVGAVRDHWPDLALAVDGNGSLTARSLAVLEPYGLTYVEQPAPADDLLGSAAFARLLSCPVALDESITSPAALELAVTVGAGSVVNLKPSRVGGPLAAAALAQSASEAGCQVFVGGMLETAVGRASAATVAALRHCTLPTDLGPSDRYFDVDVADPVMTDERGLLVVPTGPGFGRVPDAAVVERFTVDRCVMSA